MAGKKPQQVDDRIDTFLADNPLPEKYLKEGKLIEYRFFYDLKAPLARIWPRLKDTSDINERLGLSRMTFREEGGRLFGKNRIMGMVQEWEEIPWQWEDENYLTTERVYSRGPARYVRGTYLVSPVSDEQTRLIVHFAWVVRNLSGRLLLTLGRKAFEKKYGRVTAAIAEEVSKTMTFNLQPVNYLQVQKESKSSLPGGALRAIRDDLIRRDLSVELVQDLIHYISSAPEQDLYRMRPRVVARSLGRDLRPFLEVMLYATRAGLLNMTWDVVCPHCRGVRERIDHLWDVPKKGNCEVCNIDFDTTGINALEIAFHVSPQIKKVQEVFYCSAEPSKKSHIHFQKEIEEGRTYRSNLTLKEGRYRLRIQGDTAYNLLDVEEDSHETDLFWTPDLLNRSFTAAPDISLNIDNTEGNRNVYIIEENSDDADALRPADLFNFQEFRDLFSAEALSHDLSIDVGMQNILYVDIVGSTSLYHREGTSGAFAIVREYFRLNHDIARKYNGAIVKTMGDAVMISFERSIDAVRAAAAFMSIFNGHHPTSPVLVRITLNRGACLAVNLNSGIDYFGQPVNIVAKLQGYAGAGDIVMTDDFVREPLVTAYLKKKGFTMKNPRIGKVKGYGDVPYWKIKLKFPETAGESQ